MSSCEQSNNSELVLRLKQDAIRELGEKSLPINSLLWVFLARLVRKVVPWDLLASLLSMGVVACTPVALGVLGERLSGRPLSNDLATPAESSVLMFMALLFVHIPHRLWLDYVQDVSELYMDERDVRRAIGVMIGSFSPRFQTSGTVMLFFVVLVSFAVGQMYLGYTGVTLPGSLHLIPLAFAISNGLYWEAVSLLSVTDVYRCERLNVYFFDPSSTSGIAKLSRQLSIHTLLSSIMLLGLFLVFYYFRPSSISSAPQVVVSRWMVFGVTVIISAFAYHQWLLYVIIAREKERFLRELAAKISERPLDLPTAQILENIKLFTTIRNTSNTALRVGDAASYITAALLQALPFVAKRLM